MAGDAVVSRSLQLGVLVLVGPAHPLPWRAGDVAGECPGCILDGRGQVVARVDASVSAAAQHNLAHALALAINTVAGHDTADTV